AIQPRHFSHEPAEGRGACRYQPTHADQARQNPRDQPTPGCGRRRPGSRPQVLHDRQSRPPRKMSPRAPADETPVSREVEIVNKKGLHARASAKFVQTAEQFDAAITVTRGHETVGGTSIMGLMMLAAGPGMSITIKAIGKDAAKAVETLCKLVADGFGEED